LREVTRAQRARLGIFLLSSGAVAVGLLAVLTGDKLLEKRDAYFVRYKDVSVSGLDIGSQVKYHGVRVGRVERIFVDPKEVETVVVELSLDHETPVKADVEAVTSSLSLTGIKIIELTGGTSAAKTLEVGSEIPAGASTFDLISGKAEAVSLKLEQVLTNLAELTGGENQEKLSAVIGNTALILEDVHGILSDNRGNIERTVDNLYMASEDIRSLAASPELRRVLANLDTTSSAFRAAEIDKTIDDLRLTLSQAKVTFQHLDLTLLKGRHDLLTSLEILRESLDSFSEFSRTISEDPSLLLRGTRSGEVSGPVR
jgi:ABC-type transporter Mla subunit MlaD